ncbi:DUF2231 domain-containing protein [Rheinheimera aquimaris]|uniref:DUF2231 domain-containing protein n=1 Tax=Rheinheimera aquimaris TaxID=412437 RepID=A0ABP3NF49_9GAMM|nr:DUF2231 domain-containing protein [Rheinheimera aquimaris]MCB5212301.1 DUF2231 domain-containing protein [Rheinheimera aquimaris]
MSMQPITSQIIVFGHPLHPGLIHFPVAALVGLIATDVAFLYSDDPFWARASLWLAGVGAIGGWVAGLAGLFDLLLVSQIRRLITAWCHAILAVMLLSLATLNWLQRLPDPALAVLPQGIYLSVLSGLLITVTGYLGGRLVYEYAVGVNIDDMLQQDAKS